MLFPLEKVLHSRCQSCEYWSIFYFPFYFIFSFFSFFISILFRVRMKHDIIYHRMVTISCDAEKIVEGSGTDNIIQHSKSMLAL